MRDAARLVDVVAGRIGPSAVFRVSPVESHVPERAVARSDPVTLPGTWPVWRRPIRLFARPEPLFRVIALLPDQHPRRFEWRGRVYNVAAGDGPERIHGEWWRRDAEVRAKATRALPLPARFAMASAQSLRLQARLSLVRMTPAASYSSVLAGYHHTAICRRCDRSGRTGIVAASDHNVHRRLSTV